MYWKQVFKVILYNLFIGLYLFQTKEKNGQYIFNCQHGEEECYANKIHACSIAAVSNMTLSVKITECMIIDNLDADAALERVGNIFWISNVKLFVNIV